MYLRYLYNQTLTSLPSANPLPLSSKGEALDSAKSKVSVSWLRGILSPLPKGGLFYILILTRCAIEGMLSPCIADVGERSAPVDIKRIFLNVPFSIL